MNEWITESELLCHVNDYGQYSYDAILYVHEEGFMDLDHNYEIAIRESKEGGKFMIIVKWCDE